MNFGIPDLKLPLNYCYRTRPTGDETDGNSENHKGKMLRLKVKELGGMTFHECVVVVLFSTAVLLWLSRDPQFVPGWSTLFGQTGVKIVDSSVGILISILIFIMLPCHRSNSKRSNRIIEATPIGAKRIGAIR
jgi:hypothetical protein